MRTSDRGLVGRCNTPVLSFLLLSSVCLGCDGAASDPICDGNDAPCETTTLEAAKADSFAKATPSSAPLDCTARRDRVLAAPTSELATAVDSYLRASCSPAPLVDTLGDELLDELSHLASTSGDPTTTSLAQAIAKLEAAGGPQDMQYCNWHMCVWIVGSGGSCHIVWCDGNGFCQWECG